MIKMFYKELIIHVCCNPRITSVCLYSICTYINFNQIISLIILIKIAFLWGMWDSLIPDIIKAFWCIVQIV